MDIDRNIIKYWANLFESGEASDDLPTPNLPKESVGSAGYTGDKIYGDLEDIYRLVDSAGDKMYEAFEMFKSLVTRIKKEAPEFENDESIEEIYDGFANIIA
jgi:hypothetical protein